MIEINFLTMANGVVISTLFEYFPYLAENFAKLSAPKKQQVVLLTLLVTTSLLFGFNCGGIWDLGIDCTGTGYTLLIKFVANYILSVFFATTTHASTNKITNV